MAGDAEKRFAAAVADAVVKSARHPGGLAKSGKPRGLRKAARKAGREIAGESLTPLLVRLASISERIEYLEERRAQDAARFGGRA